jgi:hypothetical protein
VLRAVLGLVIYVILIVNARNEQADSGNGLPLPVGLAVALAAMLVSNVGAFRAERSRRGHD